MERRLGHRLDKHTKVGLRTSGQRVCEAEIRDLSLSGAFIRTTVPVCPSSKVELVFPASTAAKPAAVAAWVTRSESDGIGIEWIEFAPRPVSTLLFAHWTREAANQVRSLKY